VAPFSGENEQDRAIGRLEGKVDLLLRGESAATVSRKQLYEKLDSVSRKLDLTESKVESVDKRLKAVEDPVAEFSRWRERGIGVVMFIGFLSAAFGAFIATVGKKIWAAIVGG